MVDLTLQTPEKSTGASPCRRLMGLWMVLLAGLVMGLLAAPARAQMMGSASVITTKLVWSADHIRPGGQGVVALVLDIKKPFHINPNLEQILPEYKGQLIPLTVEWRDVPEGVRVGRPQFPKAQMVQFGNDVKIPGYEHQVVVYLPVVVDPAFKGEQVSFKVYTEFQSCNDTICLPPADRTLTASIATSPGAAIPATQQPAPAAVDPLSANPLMPGQGAATAPAAESTVDLFRQFDSSVFSDLASWGDAAGREVVFNLFGWELKVRDDSLGGLALILLMAMIGGLLLNFTPCVLPVIPIKVLSLKQAAGGTARRITLGAAMSLGVIAFWIALGLAIVISAALVKSAVDGGSGTSAFSSTNQLFQYPAFTITVGVVIIAMAIGMCGLCAIRLPQWVYSINPGHDSLHGSFGFGVMTAILSTPCTAPFMGSALAWAVGLSAGWVMLTFGTIGLGMALPYLILTMNPRWIDRMPRTGPASELIKQIMGLLLLAAGVFFLGTGLSSIMVMPPEPPSRIYWLAVGVIVGAAGLWLIWRMLRIGRSNVAKGVCSVLGVVMILLSIVGTISLMDKGPIDWTYYTPERLDQAKSQGKVVVIEFTAEWCLNCKTLEQSVLSRKEVASLLNSSQVAAIKVDITGNNAAGNELLNRMQSVSIPLLVVMDAKGNVVFKSDYYTAEQVIDAVARAKNTPVAGLMPAMN